ncbi:glycine-rich protein 23-like [Lycium barbarum]|uniref:glycine-rich protein 23-like n=1 Tax=Lycium barbarum TaxID=112863 RepID=UPI00293F0801|nr:glycine-rich protein 23-like [Lycium barbarum]
MATNIFLIVVLVACTLVLSTNARSLNSMKATKPEDEQKTFFRHPLPPFLGGHGLGRPVFGLGPGLGFGPFGGIGGGSGLGGGGLGFGAGTGAGAGTGFESGSGFGSSIGGGSGFGSTIGMGNGGGFGFGGDNGGTTPNADGAFAGGQGEGGDDAALGNQKP